MVTTTASTYSNGPFLTRTVAPRLSEEPPSCVLESTTRPLVVGNQTGKIGVSRRNRAVENATVRRVAFGECETVQTLR